MSHIDHFCRLNGVFQKVYFIVLFYAAQEDLKFSFRKSLNGNLYGTQSSYLAEN